MITHLFTVLTYFLYTFLLLFRKRTNKAVYGFVGSFVCRLYYSEPPQVATRLAITCVRRLWHRTTFRARLGSESLMLKRTEQPLRSFFIQAAGLVYHQPQGAAYHQGRSPPLYIITRQRVSFPLPRYSTGVTPMTRLKLRLKERKESKPQSRAIEITVASVFLSRYPASLMR